MVPDGCLGPLLFLVFGASGLLFEMLSERRRAGYSESAFREISRVVLASLLFSGIATTVVVIAVWSMGQQPPDAGQLLRTRSTFATSNPLFVAAAIGAEVAIALLLTLVAHSLMMTIGGGANIKQQSAWTEAFRRACPPGCEPHVRARLVDGTVYVGKLANFSADFELEDRELVLAPPILSKTGGHSPTEVPAKCQRVVIPERAVEVLSVEDRRCDLGAIEGPVGRASGVARGQCGICTSERPRRSGTRPLFLCPEGILTRNVGDSPEVVIGHVRKTIGDN